MAWKGVCQGCIWSPCFFNLYAEYIMRNAGLEETQAGIKTARRNIYNLRYADDTTLMAKSEGELRSLLIPAYASSSPAFLMMYSAYKLNKQGDNMQPWHTPFPIWNQSAVPCPVLTVASWSAYRFLKRQVRLSGIPISFRIFPSLLWSTGSLKKQESSRKKNLFLLYWLCQSLWLCGSQ